MIITGYARLGKDAEVRFTPDGTAVANLALVYNYGKKGDDGNRPSQWIDASLWGQRAESLEQYLLKGQGLDVVIEEVHIETYHKRDGTSGSKLVGRIMAIEFAGGPPQQAAQPGQQRQAQQQRPAPAWSVPLRRQAPAPSAGGFDDMDDDIPF